MDYIKCAVAVATSLTLVSLSYHLSISCFDIIFCYLRCLSFADTCFVVCEMPFSTIALLRLLYFLRFTSWFCFALCLLVWVTRESPVIAADRLRPLDALSLPPLLLLLLLLLPLLLPPLPPLPLSAFDDEEEDDEDEAEAFLPPVLRGTGLRTEG